MLGAKHVALAEYLIAANCFQKNSFDYYTEDGSLKSMSDVVAAESIKLGEYRYKAFFEITGYKDTPDLIIALICLWLEQFDNDRENDDVADPSIDVEQITHHDQRVVNLSVIIEFKEDLTITKDAQGVLTHDGESYGVQEATINVATSGTLMT